MRRSSAAIKVLATLLILRVLACPIAAGHGSPLEGRFIVRVCVWPAPTLERSEVAAGWTASQTKADSLKAPRPVRSHHDEARAQGAFLSGWDGDARHSDASAQSCALRC